MSDSLKKLEAIEQIKNLKGRYLYCLDTKDWDGYGQVFTQDCVMDMSSEVPPGMDPTAMVLKGREQISQTISYAVANSVTVHHAHTPIINLEDDETATGIWGLEDNVFYADGSNMHGFGHYHERYRKTEGRWEIAAIKVTRLMRLNTVSDGR
jgi:SnoaL-like domain